MDFLLLVKYVQTPVVIESLHDLHPSVQFSRSVVFDSLRPHELQHAKSLLKLMSI